jgi:methyl-accepting chemotaxis protein
VRPRTIRTRLLVLTLPVIGMVVAVLSVYSALSAKSSEEQGSRREAGYIAEARASEFDAQARAALATGETISLLTKNSEGISRQVLSTMVRRVAEDHPDYLGSYVAMEPDVIGKDADYVGTPVGNVVGRFAPYWNRLGGPFHLDPLDDLDKQDYYNGPKAAGKPTIVEPYDYQGTLMTSYITPILRDGKFIGIGGVDVGLNELNAQISKLRFFDHGYGMLVSNGGIFVAAPQTDLIGKKTLTAVAADKNGGALTAVAAGVAAGRAGTSTGRDPFTGRESTFFYAPVTTGNWAFIAVVPDADFQAQAAHMTQRLLWLGAAALALVGIWLAFVAVWLTRPIRQLEAAATRISTGDLDVQIDVRTRDEIGRTAQAFIGMRSYLQETAQAAERIAGGDLTAAIEARSDRDVLRQAFAAMTAQLRGVVGQITEAAQTTADAASEVSTGVNETGRSMSDVAQIAAEMSANASHQSAALAQVTSAAATAHRHARSGTATADQVAGAMRELSGTSDRIGRMVGTITAIARQTNLLALNAAIEAARAGDAGRGFGVVAEEVRKLAEESGTAATSISALVDEVQQAAARAVALAEGEGLVAFRQIEESVTTAADAVDATLPTVEVVSTSAEHLSESTHQVAAAQEEMGASCRSLTHTATELQRLVAQFAITTPAPGRRDPR